MTNWWVVRGSRPQYTLAFARSAGARTAARGRDPLPHCPAPRRLARLLGPLLVPLLVLGSLTPAAAAGPSVGRASQPAFVGERGAGQASPPAPTGRLIVRYRPGVDAAERRSLRDAERLDLAAELPLIDAEVVAPQGRQALDAVPGLARRGEVLSVEPEYRRTAFGGPIGEPDFGQLWGLNNAGFSQGGLAGAPNFDMNVPEAWDVTTGSPTQIVAVIDDGVDFSHPDLAGSQWVNPGEVAGDGLDNDGNGLKDDVNGWDFCHEDASVHDVGDDRHGTHVAGTIAARGNGIGIAGVAPSVKIMAIKFLSSNDTGCGTDAQAIEAIAYAAAQGARIINASWGGYGVSSALGAAIAAVPSVLVVAAAGNDNIDNDSSPVYPASYDLPNVLSVANAHYVGFLSGTTNYGVSTVDVAAPGTAIWSSIPAPAGGVPGWMFMSGTSMAAANASGVAALATSAKPSLYGNATALRDHLIRTGRAMPGATGWIANSRLLDARAAVVARPDIARIAGADRYATAAAMSAAVYPPRVEFAFVAVGTNFPDALAGGPLAAAVGAPVLLTQGSDVPAATLQELSRLRPDTIIVLGGPSVISDVVVTKLRGYATSGNVGRIFGADRYATAAEISRSWSPVDVPVAYVATGRNFPDALAGVPAAGLGPSPGPLLLVTESTIPASTATALGELDPGRIVILGGPSVVGDGVASALAAYTSGGVSRLYGADRYATAAAISSSGLFSLAGTIFVATGRNFPDSLAGGSPGATGGAPLLLVPGASVPAVTQGELQRIGPARIYVLGGPSVVSEGVVATIRGFFP